MFSIIAAISKNNVIGKDNSLICNLPDDLKRFKELTMNKTIIMGRKTFESLPYVLPGREHIVITKNTNYKFIHKNVKIFNNVADVIHKFINSSQEVFIIGGGEIYSIFLDYCEKMYITEIMEEFQGDTYFPNILIKDWKIIYKSEILQYNKINFQFKEFIKII